MKKTLCLCMLIIFLFLLSSCESSKIDIHNVNNEICLMMEEKARSEDYWQMQISGTYMSYEEERKVYMANDYDRPIRCYKIQLTDIEKAKDKVLFREERDREHFDKLSDSLKQDIESVYYKNDFHLMNSIVNNIIMYGNYGIGSHICDTTKKLGNKKMDNVAAAYLYIFETGKPIIVVCGYETESNAIAKGMFITNSDYETLSKTRDIFEPYGCSVEVDFEN